jgi:hypothetical protein
MCKTCMHLAFLRQYSHHHPLLKVTAGQTVWPVGQGRAGQGIEERCPVACLSNMLHGTRFGASTSWY